jgi:lysophospholipase L1-like esterase
MVTKFSLLSFLLIAFGAFSETSASTPDTRNLAVIKTGESIAFLGDSITAGGGNHGGYCRLVVHGLKTKGIRVNGIYAGIPGNKSSDMLLRLDRLLQRKPDHLFLSVGVNDVWHTDPTAKIGVYKPSPGMGVQFDHYKVYVPQILDRCKAAGTKVIMSTFTQITEDPEFRLNKKANIYNDFLRSLAKKRNLPIALLNEAAFARIAELKAKGTSDRNPNMISSDGIHPTAIGHQTMALGILETMGFSDKELVAAEKEWATCAKLILLGDRQVTSGGRSGGWRNMLLDAFNSKRKMIEARPITAKKTTVATLQKELLNVIDDKRARYLLLVPPMADIQDQTSLADYKTALESLIATAQRGKLEVVMTTFPLVGSDAKSKINASAVPYNDVLRQVCKAHAIPLADIAAVMQAFYNKHPDTPLNMKGERLNHQGGKLMVETVSAAFGLDSATNSSLQDAWSRATSYTFKYSNMVHFNLAFTMAGEKALQDISDRYHKLDVGKIHDLGIHMLLHGDATKNRERISFVDKHWLGQSPDTVEKTFRKHPNSAKQAETFKAYIQKEGISDVTFYQRAFKVGLYALRKEDPLGRGEF